MQTETQATTGQTDTAPATQQAATDQGTAPTDGGQQQQTQQAAQQTSETTQGTTAQGNTEQTKTDADAKAAGKAPEQYADFTVPEGYKMEGELGNEFKSLAKELNLTQEQAQKLIDLDVKRSGAQAEVVQQASAEWLAQAQADKEFGGEALAGSVAIAQKALNTFGTPALKDLLQKSGLGNHPEIIRAFYRAGKTISEDRFVPANGNSNAQSDPAKTLFPNQA